MPEREPEHIETVVIGGGQAGLSVGYHLARQARPFVILDASQRVGDAWRQRWDSLRLFTPARYNALAGSRFPPQPTRSPAKTRWPTTWRPTRHASSCRSAPASG
jgi:putative flavoprotein involved in K+ transport